MATLKVPKSSVDNRSKYELLQFKNLRVSMMSISNYAPPAVLEHNDVISLLMRIIVD